MQIVSSTTPSGTLTRTANVPGRTYGSLTFGVGRRDEPIALAGISHLVLHLVEAALEPKLIPATAAVDEDTIRFDASGTTAQVLSHLRAVADAVVALSSVTSYELARAKHLLALEEPVEARHPGVDLLTFRYGLGEIGRSAFGFPTLGTVTKKDVARWASRLSAENAAVALTKPLSASFDLDLPVGPTPEHSVAVQLASTPTLLASENGGVAASIVVPAAGSGALAIAIRLGLVERLVDQAGLVYDVTGARSRVGADDVMISYEAGPAVEDISETVRALVHALHDIADDGVSAAAIALARETVRLDLASDPASVLESLSHSVAAELRGFTAESREDELEAAITATSESVAAAVRAALPSLLVAFDHGANLKKVAKALALPIDPFEILHDAPHKLWKRAMKAEGARVFEARNRTGAAASEAIVTEGALLHRFDGQSIAAVDFDDLVLVGERPSGTLVLVDGAGRWLPFEAADWKSGKQFIKALRKALPPELLRPFRAV